LNLEDTVIKFIEIGADDAQSRMADAQLADAQMTRSREWLMRSR
jgi:hypothetical protein